MLISQLISVCHVVLLRGTATFASPQRADFGNNRRIDFVDSLHQPRNVVVDRECPVVEKQPLHFIDEPLFVLGARQQVLMQILRIVLRVVVLVAVIEWSGAVDVLRTVDDVRIVARASARCRE